MTHRSRALVFLLATLATWGACAAEPDAPRLPDSDRLEVRLQDGFLTLNAREAPLASVLRAIGEEAGFEVVIEGDLEAQVTWSLTDLPLDQGLRHLLGGVDFIMVFRGSDSAKRLAELRVYPDVGSGGGPLEPEARIGEARSQAEMEAWIRGRLSSPQRDTRIVAVRRLARLEPDVATKIAARMLGSETDTVVRGQIVATLGKIGGDEALDLLEEALAEEQASVRKHAIRALRAVGAEQATPVLGRALTEDPDQEIRLMALETLIATPSDTTRYYLTLAANDPDETIRQRANQALQASKDGQAPQ